MTIDEIRKRLAEDPRSFGQIAEACGCARQQLSRFANGDRDITATLLCKLIAALGLTIK